VNDLEQVIDAAVRGAHLARRIAGVAAGVVRIGGFEHDHVRTLLPRRERRGHRGVTRADDDDVAHRRHACNGSSPPSRRTRPSAP
jgi:hypothetical protein